jgi:HSP20 family molecular chaperone IbpA
MQNIDEQLKQVEGIYRQVTGAEPKRSEQPLTPIPPDANPEQYVQEKLNQLQAAMVGGTAGTAAAATLPMVAPRVALFESEREWRCLVELPGVKKGDLAIQAAQGLLRISALRPLVGERPLYTELFPCRFERTLPLPPSAKEDSCDARLDSGILTVRCTKDPIGSRRNVKIEVV